MSLLQIMNHCVMLCSCSETSMVHEDVQGGAGGYGDRSADTNLLCQAQEGYRLAQGNVLQWNLCNQECWICPLS